MTMIKDEISRMETILVTNPIFGHESQMNGIQIPEHSGTDYQDCNRASRILIGISIEYLPQEPGWFDVTYVRAGL
jgi:hypothetical protein